MLATFDALLRITDSLLLDFVCVLQLLPLVALAVWYWMLAVTSPAPLLSTMAMHSRNVRRSALCPHSSTRAYCRSLCVLRCRYITPTLTLWLRIRTALVRTSLGGEALTDYLWSILQQRSVTVRPQYAAKKRGADVQLLDLPQHTPVIRALC